MRITIDHEACISSGECTYNHPTLFRFADDGRTEVLVAEVTTPRQIEEARQAVEVCPSGAIALKE